MNATSKKFMARAVQLAEKGGRDVTPNPMVGAVVAKNGKIIGEGYHKRFGGPHAEVNAIKSVKNKADLVGATIYVTLEPCRHHGKTPPCQELIEKVGISKVVCAIKDPFQKGKLPANVEVFQADDCEELNKFYFTRIRKNRPYITVKIATSADGFVAGPNGEQIHFTSAAQDKRVHQLRAQHEAILVGSNTVIMDNPRLTVRHVKGPDPLRVILDSKKQIPKDAHVFDDDNYLHITKRIPLKSLMQQLAEKKIGSLLVEPGPTLYAALKKEKLIDDLIILKGRKKIGKGLKLS